MPTPMPTKLLRPARPDLIVRGPDGQTLPPEGAERAYSTFWRRRVRDGDVLATDPQRAAPAKRAQRATHEEQ